MSGANPIADLPSATPQPSAKSGAGVTGFAPENGNGGLPQAPFRQSMREANARVHSATTETSGTTAHHAAVSAPRQPVPIRAENPPRAAQPPSASATVSEKPGGNHRTEPAKSSSHHSEQASPPVPASPPAQASLPGSSAVSARDAIMAIYGVPMPGSQPPHAQLQISATNTESIQTAATSSKSGAPHTTARGPATGGEPSTPKMPLNSSELHNGVESLTGQHVEPSTPMTGHTSTNPIATPGRPPTVTPKSTQAVAAASAQDVTLPAIPDRTAVLARLAHQNTGNRHSHAGHHTAEMVVHGRNMPPAGTKTLRRAATMVENRSHGSLSGGSLSGGELADGSLSGGSLSIGPVLLMDSSAMPMIGQTPNAMATLPISGAAESPPSPPSDTVLRMSAPGWEAVLAGRLAMAQPGQTFSVTAHPLTMGPIQVLATRANNGGMRIHLTAQHADTVAMLQQGAPVIAAQILGNGNTIMGNGVTVTASVAQGTPSQSFFSSQQGSRDSAPHSDGQSAFARNVQTGHGPAGASGRSGQNDSSTIIGTASFESWV